MLRPVNDMSDLCDACEQSPGPLCTSCAVREEERRIRADEVKRRFGWVTQEDARAWFRT